MRKARWVGLVLLIVLTPSTVFYIWAVQTDYYIPRINPAPPPTEIPLVLTYPPYTTNPATVCAVLNIELESNGSLTQGVPVRVSVASGEVYSLSCGNISDVFVLIDGAMVEGEILTIGRAYGLSSAEVAGFVNWNYLNGTSLPLGTGNLTAGTVGPFEFPVSGTYSPTVVVETFNRTSSGTNYNTNVYTYSDYKIPVVSALDIQNAKNAKIQTVLTYVIVAFVFLEGFSIVWELTEEKAQHSDAPQPTPSATNPTQTKMNPTT